jgi:quinolinate synthase
MYLRSTGDLPPERTFVLGTGGMVARARASEAKQFIVATETGMLHRLRKENPAADYVAANTRAVCSYMKMITPEALLNCLETGRDEVTVAAEIAGRARVAIERMVAIS